MPIQDRYQGGARLQGQVPLIASSLEAFFNERARMNDAALAYEQANQEDPDELAKMEIKARQQLADLVQAVEESRRQAGNDASDLRVAMINNIGRIEAANITGGATVSAAKVRGLVDYMQLADKVRKDLADASALTAETSEAIATTAETYKNTTSPTTLVGAVDSILKDARATPGTPRYDNIILEMGTKLRQGGPRGHLLADELVRQRIPAAAAQNMSEVEYFAKTYATRSPEEMGEQFKKDARWGSYRSPQVLATQMAAMGLPIEPDDMEDDQVEVATKTKTRGASPVGVDVSGSPSAVRAFGQAIESGADTNEAIKQMIDSQFAHIDDLKRRREAASGKRASLYPRANRYVANPNVYQPDVTERWQVPELGWERNRGLETVEPVPVAPERDWRAQNPNPQTPRESFMPATSVNTMLKEGKRAGGPMVDPLLGTKFEPKPGAVAQTQEAIDADVDWNDIDSFGVEPAKGTPPAEPDMWAEIDAFDIKEKK